jgi:tripartite-type tricarboxylate transporter receptor subunit TctC
VNVRESEDAPSISVRPRRTSPGSHPLKGRPCSALRRRIGTDYVAKAPSDGYTLLMGSAASISSAPAVYAKLPYDPVRDLAPIIQVANQPNVLTAHPSVPARTLKEFIAIAKANPGKFNYGSSGIGASQHMTAELFAMLTGVKIEHIPYKGGTPAMTDLISGQIDFMFTPAPNAIAFVKSSKIRGIAVTSLKRSSALPELPTMDESGLKGFELLGWIGLLGPAGTPREIVDRLNGEINKMLAGDIRPRLTELGLDAVGGTPEQFAAFIRQDIAKYVKIVKVAGIAPQ